MITKLPLPSSSRWKFLQGLPEDYESPSKKNNLNRFDSVYSLKQKISILFEALASHQSRQEICAKYGIDEKTINYWTSELSSELTLTSTKDQKSLDNLSQEKRFSLVLEGKTGISSIAEICRREGINHDTFLSWCKDFVQYRNQHINWRIDDASLYYRNKRRITSIVGSKAVDYFELYLDLNRTVIQSTSSGIEISGKKKTFDSIIYLKRLNDERYINKFLESVNSKLDCGNLFLGCFETFTARKNKMAISKLPIIGDIYFSIEFIFKRILPKVSFTKKLYFDFTKGNDRLLSKAEALGRLVSCGFKIMDYKSIDGLVYFVVKKEQEPYYDLNPSYGPIFKMSRIGKGGKTIGVYKFRTMHPYSEYLQDYVLNANGYGNKGKPANDFRIPAWGKFMRRFWLDELPQLINVLKGEMKLVGIRPVSERYFQDIPMEMRKLRTTQKPGCIPPYVALNRKADVMSVLQAEKEYLEEKLKNPYFTDVRYFFNALFNIIVRHKRSA